MDVFVGLLMIVILVLVGLVVFLNKRHRQKYKQLSTAQEIEFDMLQHAAQHAEQEFAEFRDNVTRKETQKRETEQRRRVTPKTKQAVLERDEYTCQICGISKKFLDGLCPGLGDYLLLEVDHIISVKQGGSGDSASNLQTLCWRCNRKKSGTKTNADVLAAIDYGAKKLVPACKEVPKPLTRAEQFANETFCTVDGVANFMIVQLGASEQVVDRLVEKVLHSELPFDEFEPPHTRDFSRELGGT